MKIIVFDCETTGLEKPFCYDLGYLVIDTDTQETIDQKHFIIEQTWHNLQLFESAYYKAKRPLYIQLMRQHRAKMDKWGYIMQEMRRDIKKYNVSGAYAYNSDFDEKVFNFNCDWFKCNNPLEDIPIFDIWAYASKFITTTPDYKQFCEDNSYFTDTGNYKGSAEIVFRYIMNDLTFEESHMGLHDAEIESIILLDCVKHGAKYAENYKLTKILPRITDHPLKIKIDGKEIFAGTYKKKYIRGELYSFTT